MFASNVPRVGAVLALAAAAGKKVILAGRGMQANLAIARELGLVEVPPGVVADGHAHRAEAGSHLPILGRVSVRPDRPDCSPPPSAHPAPDRLVSHRQKETVAPPS